MLWYEGRQRYAKISCSSSGANIIVAAVAGQKIRVLQWVVSVVTAVNVKWQSHTIPTDLTGLHYFGDNGGVSVPLCDAGLFETLNGESLDLNLSAGVAVGGSVVYLLI